MTSALTRLKSDRPKDSRRVESDLAIFRKMSSFFNRESSATGVLAPSSEPYLSKLSPFPFPFPFTARWARSSVGALPWR